MNYKTITYLFISLFLLSCGSDAKTFISIDEYIELNELAVKETASGLKYIIEIPGSDEKPNINSSVTVKYKGYRTDDFVFDSSFDGINFPLSNVILGWQEGIALFGKGGKGVLFIPSALAYGSAGRGADIPPNTDLIFDVELIDF